MNIYDFDNTIFDGDSSCKFILYSIKKHPILLIESILKALKETIKKMFGKSDFGNVKGELFSFVKKIDNFDDYVNNFILKYSKNIKRFYLEGQKEDDVIISASFDFIVVPFCKSIGIKNIIATKYDVKKGKIIGKNCKGREKIVRFREIYKKEVVSEAYSDSLSDIPMFEIAKKAYLVKKKRIIPYVKD